jgi:hypothetical protein
MDGRQGAGYYSCGQADRRLIFSRTILPCIRATQDYEARRMDAVWDQSVRLSTTFPSHTDHFHRGESIADHMYRMSLMTMAAPPSLASRLDLCKCMKMCLIHDMPESLVGDLTPADGVPKTERVDESPQLWTISHSSY